ncbi:hypothetical protein FACS189426_10040 [Bacteroidia bacterium]|nr:hypothetical protein FACS189426_10040 [Bacteroidia bacterium]GHV70931.1 hypothetical protein FACS189420_4050 [Bacteroidia bacterium]
MKNKLILVFALTLLISTTGNAQDCNCESNFEWIKKTFEENDAGFQYIIDSKGKQAYDIHNALSFEKIKSAKTSIECTTLLYEWLTFFRKGHIGIERLTYGEVNNQQTNNQSTLNTDNWETIDIDIEKFSNYLDGKKEADFEGIWETQLYTIAIKKEGDNYIGFIVESENKLWKKGEVKLKIIREGENLKSIFYMGNRSVNENNNAVEFIGTNHLQIGNINLKRLRPQLPVDLSAENYFKIIFAANPYAEEIDSTTLLLRIPSFKNSKALIDSVIFANKEKILRTKNLIIDIRNNGGGSDTNFSEIIPFLYTNPIRTVGVAYLSTKQNNQRWLDLLNGVYGDLHDSDKKWVKTAYDKLEAHLGEFVDINSKVISVKELDTIYVYPKNIGIIINGENASTTEQFLLAAKQSKKVKLFGTTTSGALDISNLHFIESPCKEFKLWYGLSKSHRIPNMTIDDKGIHPDYYIDKTIPSHKWVDFVKEVLNKW